MFDENILTKKSGIHSFDVLLFKSRPMYQLTRRNFCELAALTFLPQLTKPQNFHEVEVIDYDNYKIDPICGDFTSRRMLYVDNLNCKYVRTAIILKNGTLMVRSVTSDAANVVVTTFHTDWSIGKVQDGKIVSRLTKLDYLIA